MWVARHIRHVTGLELVCGIDFQAKHYTIVAGVGTPTSLAVPADGWPGAARRVLYTDRRTLTALLYSTLLDYGVVIEDEVARRAAGSVWEEAGTELPW